MSHSQLVKNLGFEMASDSSFTVRVSLFEELGMRLKNPLFLQVASLMKQFQLHLQYEPLTNDLFPQLMISFTVILN